MKKVGLNDIASKVAMRVRSDQSQTRRILRSAMDVIRGEVTMGNQVELPNLLTLGTQERVVSSQGQTASEESATVMLGTEKHITFEVDKALKRAIEGVKSYTTLLVVPRKDFFIGALVSRLKSKENQVFVAEGSLASLEAIESHRPDIIIVDAGTPNTDQIVAGVKKNQQTSFISALLLYPEGFDPDVVEGLRVCEDEYLVEPYDADRLVELCRSELMRSIEERGFFEHEMHFQFQTHPDTIEQANDLLSHLVVQTDFDEDAAGAVTIAFREAVDNAARHGNKGRSDRIIDVIYLLDREKVTITVEDEGDGFDTESFLTRGRKGDAVTAARERIAAGRIGGLGIMLMLKCVDDLEYNRAGNLVKLTKFRDQ